MSHIPWMCRTHTYIMNIQPHHERPTHTHCQYINPLWMGHTHIHTLSIYNLTMNVSHKYIVNIQPHHECATCIHTKSCDIQDPNKCWCVTCIEGKTFVDTRHDVIKQFGVYWLRQSVATSSSLVWFQRDSIHKTNETEALNVFYQILTKFSSYAFRQQTL